MDSKKPKICFVSNAYPEYDGDMRGHFVRHLAISLEDYEVSVVVPKIFTRTVLEEIRDKEKIYRFPFFSENKLLIEYQKIPKLRMISYLISGTLRTIQVVVMNRCKLIHSHWILPSGFIGLLVAKLVRRPFGITSRGSDIEFALKNKMLFIIAKFVLRHASFIVVVSHALKKDMAHQLNVDEDRIFVIPSGIDTSRFRPIQKDEVRSRLGLPNDKKIVLFAGGFVHVKGIPYLINAVAQIVEKYKDILLVLVGDGELKPELQELVHKHGIKEHVLFAGKRSTDEMPYWMNAADIVVLPSLHEGMPNVVLEAMSCGISVIATKVGGVVEVITDGVDGLLVEPADSTEISNKIDFLFSNPQIHAEISERARTKVLEYDVKNSVKNMMKIYENVLTVER